MTPPVLVYDDDCSFCTDAAELLARHGTLSIVGFGDLSPEYEARLPENYRECAHLVVDDTVYSCGEAVERAIAHTGALPRPVARGLRALPGSPSLRELGYRFVARNRTLYGRLFD